MRTPYGKTHSQSESGYHHASWFASHGLRRGGAGLPRAVGVGRRVRPVPERGRRRLRHDRVGRGAARVERQGRDVRLLLPRPRPAPRRGDAAAQPGRDLPRLHLVAGLRRLDLLARRDLPRLGDDLGVLPRPRHGPPKRRRRGAPRGPHGAPARDRRVLDAAALRPGPRSRPRACRPTTATGSTIRRTTTTGSAGASTPTTRGSPSRRSTSPAGTTASCAGRSTTTSGMRGGRGTPSSGWSCGRGRTSRGRPCGAPTTRTWGS